MRPVQLWDVEGFAAHWGPRTAERRSRHYNFTCAHPCTWNGPSWPYETSRLLTGLAHALNTQPDHVSNAPRAQMRPVLCLGCRLPPCVQHAVRPQAVGKPVPGELASFQPMQELDFASRSPKPCMSGRPG